MTADGHDAAIVAALRSPDLGARRAALEELAASGGALSAAVALAVLESIGAEAKALQRRAADVLVQSDDAARPLVLTRLREACSGTDPRRRWGATFALGRLGVREPAMIAPLLESLGAADGDQRWAAAGLMVACGRVFGGTLVPILLRALDPGGPELRKMVLYVLRDLAPGTPEVTDALIACMRDPDVGVRLAALSGLCRLAPLPESACDLVLGMLRDDPDPGLRRAAMSALGHVGRGIVAVREALEAAAASDDPGLRRAATAARRRLEDDPAG